MASAERREIVDVPLKAFFDAVNDFEAYPKFVTGMKEAKLLGEEGGVKRVHFDMDMMKRVQYSVKLKSRLDEAAGHGEVSWTLDQSEFFKKNDGLWQLKAAGPTRTEVLYRLDIEFAFSVPGFVLKGLIAKGLPAAIAEFTKRAQAARK